MSSHELMLLLQPARALATVRVDLRQAGGGEQPRHGLLNRHPLHDAAFRHHVHCVLQLAHE